MIGILDYGMGNIKAFYNLYKENNIKVEIIDDYKDLKKNIKKLILPGVGSFDGAIKLLKKKNLFDEVKNYSINKENKILGICSGMQILGESSEEGEEQGLNLIEGNNFKLKKGFLPHMGWNSVQKVIDDKIFDKIEDGQFFYFLHSFYFKEKNIECAIAKSNYENNFTSVLKNNNIYAVQFHPEKSHKSGIQLLKNFYEL